MFQVHPAHISNPSFLHCEYLNDFNMDNNSAMICVSLVSHIVIVHNSVEDLTLLLEQINTELDEIPRVH